MSDHARAGVSGLSIPRGAVPTAAVCRTDMRLIAQAGTMVSKPHDEVEAAVESGELLHEAWRCAG